MEKEKRKHCSGCYCDFYNKPDKDCWHLKDAKLILRKEVHIDQTPPWKQKPKMFYDCYHKQRYGYVGPDQEY